MGSFVGEIEVQRTNVVVHPKESQLLSGDS